MRSRFVLPAAACVAMLLLAVLPGAPPAAAQPPEAEREVRQTEERRVKALVDDDFATLEAILADDLTYTHSNALVDTKASFMAALRSGKTKYEAFDRQPPLVRVYGDTAIMTGQASVGLRGRPDRLELRYTLLYVRQAGAWRMVAWQSTRLPQAG
jgi:ketosteroid isomerase-like protein